MPFEVLTIAGETVEHGETDNCTWRRSNSLQFSAISLPLSVDDDYESVAYEAYKQLLKFIKQSPHPELVRFWNYIPFINKGAGDAENYKRFCSGRLTAFSENDYGDLQFPAASAVGHYQQGITVYALTASNTATHHANPRQVDAFKYPRQYGPSSPSFARATTIELGDHEICFISGTASILGHNTVHRDDLRLQLYTTNDNILYLLKETGFKRSNIATLRVYLRHQDDLAECKSIVEDLFPDSRVIYTHADICREELLAEIECFCVSA
jgi:chorismate lyase/3-hydroxybenzoate synthase